MATNLVPPLDESLAQLYCPLCDANGVADSPLIREMHIAKCQLGHQFSSIGEAIARGAKMIPMTLNEQPPLTSIKWSVWVHPRVKEILLQKYKGRLIATLDSIFGCLADGNVIIITGADADKLKKKGIGNGAQMVAALESMEQTERERETAIKENERFRDILRAAGV